jgi:hypothetical protein
MSFAAQSEKRTLCLIPYEEMITYMHFSAEIQQARKLA